MASATLNSTLMETLVTRSVAAINSCTAENRSKSQNFSSPPSISPSSVCPTSSFLPLDSPLYNNCSSEGDIKENSPSGDNDSTEEDEEERTRVAENVNYYLKRSAEDLSYSLAKKRRKQVKPSKVPLSIEQDSKLPFSEDIKRQHNMSNQINKNVQILKCPHCLLEVSSGEALRSHIIEDHIGTFLAQETLRNKSTIRYDVASDAEFREREEGEMTPLNLSSPKWANQSDSQARENGDRSPESGISASSMYGPSTYSETKFGIPGLVPLAPSPFLMPFLHQPIQNQERDRMQASSLRSVSNGPSQIFNLEAFCELCNKEFCNKYFLKTHKANKHGVYSPDLCMPPQSASSCSNTSTSIPQSTVPNISISNSSSVQMSVPPMPAPSIGGIPLPGSSFAGAFITANMSTFPIRPILPSHYHPLQKYPLSFPKHDVLGNATKNTVLNIEAYCEICQKEFCNKYFLKRHKSKIHNIDIEVTIKNTRSFHPDKQGCDRPEGWCDACRKNIGTRSALNSHKLNVHGPHIMVPMTSNNDPCGNSDSQKSPREKDSGNIQMQDNFSPWDNKRDISKTEEGEVKNYKFIMNNERLRLSSPFTETNAESYKTPISKEVSLRETKGCFSEENWKENREGLNNVRREVNSEISNVNTFMKEENVLHQFKSTTKDPKMSREDETLNERAAIKLKCEKESFQYPSDMSESKIVITPTKDIMEPPRTPGNGSSADENSRELGLVTRIGQAPIAQPPAGTKYSADQLRQFGVINPDAFCELCCKEFCNKYFLRTHRIKKHGIYTPEYSDRSRSFKDFSPVNLSKIFEKQNFDLRPPILENDGDFECDICRRTFPAIYLLHMHKYYIHGPGQELLQQEHLFKLQQQSIQPDILRSLAYSQRFQKMEETVEGSRSFTPPTLPQQSDDRKDSNPTSRFEVQKLETSNNSCSTFNQDKSFTEKDKSKLSPDTSTIKISSCEKSAVISSDPSNANNAVKLDHQEPDTSQDLRKLQSMLWELNRQENVGRCRICQKEVGDKYILRAHLITEHGIFPHNEPNKPTDGRTPRTSREGTPDSSSNSAVDNQGYCNLCKRDFFSKYILQQHLLSSHGIFTPPNNPVSFLDRIRAELENRDDRRVFLSSRSYCEICNKELCNKYFMKTHMLKMHGINIENGSSGGVTCDICKKDLCSKYFLRVHRQNTHGLVDENADDIQADDVLQICPLCSKKFKNIKWLQTHLTSDHDDEGKEKWKAIEKTIPNWEGSLSSCQICALCDQTFPDLMTLQVHVMKYHHEVIEQSNNDIATITRHYRCQICHRDFTSLESMYEHEKEHEEESEKIILPNNQQYQCPLCLETMHSFEIYHQHVIKHQWQGFFNPVLSEDRNVQLNASSLSCEKTPENQGESPETNFENRTPSTPKKRWRCYECGTKFKSRKHCFHHVQSRHVAKARLYSVSRSPCRRKLFRCNKCGGVAKTLDSLRKHLRKKHFSTIKNSTNSARRSIPDCQFLMQPFMLNKGEVNSNVDQEQFVPSLVYLPVSKKIQRPLTVSFCLTPA